MRGVSFERTFSTIYVWTVWNGSAESFFVDGGIDFVGHSAFCAHPDFGSWGAGIAGMVLFSYVFPEYIQTICGE